MGIREYFEKEQGRDLKLTDLNLEVFDEEKVNLKFDAEKEISETQISEMKDKIGLWREIGDWEGFAKLATSFKILFPERIEELGLRESDWRAVSERFLEILKLKMGKGKWQFFSEFLDIGIGMKILFPEKFEELEHNKILEGLFKIEKTLKHKGSGFYLELAVLIKILYPNKWKEKMSSIDKQWLWSEQALNLEIFRKDEDWYSFTTDVLSLRIIFPERIEELGLNNEIWAGARNELKDIREERDIDGFANFARVLKILAAEEINFTDQGLELVMSKRKLEAKKRERPVRRRF